MNTVWQHPDGAEDEDREFALPLHHACLNEGPAALQIAYQLIRACTQWEGGIKKKDRMGRLPLHYSCQNESELGDNITEEVCQGQWDMNGRGEGQPCQLRVGALIHNRPELGP